jgi:hypothetical protein
MKGKGKKAAPKKKAKLSAKAEESRKAPMAMKDKF